MTNMFKITTLFVTNFLEKKPNAYLLGELKTRFTYYWAGLNPQYGEGGRGRWGPCLANL